MVLPFNGETIFGNTRWNSFCDGSIPKEIIANLGVNRIIVVSVFIEFEVVWIFFLL